MFGDLAFYTFGQYMAIWYYGIINSYNNGQRGKLLVKNPISNWKKKYLQVTFSDSFYGYEIKKL